MKRHVIVFSCVLSLVIGLSAGFVLRGLVPEKYIAAQTPVSADSSAPEPDADDYSLLTASLDVAKALRDSDFALLASMTHPEDGLTFTPCSTVDPNTNLTFTPSQISAAKDDSSTYIWGISTDGSTPIKLKIEDYFCTYVWNTDYSCATEIGVDRVMRSGSALENVSESYPDCRFVDYTVSSSEREWSSLKLVFRWYGGNWMLVGIIHSAPIA